VPAKTYGDGSNPWSAPFDYRQISLYADYVAVMTYDEHGYSTGPGPIASVPWMNSVIQYAVDQMPRAKILLGIPAYGFDWGDSGAPTYLSYPRAMASLATSGAVLVRDPASDVPHFTYVKNGQRHEVWFEDARSWAKKLDLVEDYDLGGVAIWRLGMEDPASWRLFPEK
jgi:spore germination protein YaaH